MLDKNDLSQIKKIVHEETTKIIDAKLKPIKQDIAQIRKDNKTIIAFFDREYLDLRKRVERIEGHLNLPPLSQTQ